MILDNICLLAADTTRTKAYLDKMIKEKILPRHCIVYTDDINKIKDELLLNHTDKKNKYFNEKKPLLLLLEEAGISYEIIPTRDINSEKMLETLKSISMKYIIYSGYGGQILKNKLFDIEKKYIHVHAGILPEYRGSTTAYYSILEKEYIGASAIFLNKNIDEGDLITCCTFSLPINTIDIDLIYEPYLRSIVLIKALKLYIQNNKFPTTKQREENAKTYFVIHPVLKHLAIMKCPDE